ncbi:hypothetical protein BJX64DRAFT_288434 [Aspergillus heterothallicus]
MANRPVFPNWVGRTIRMTTTTPPSVWTLETKGGRVGCVAGTFLCHNADDTADKAAIKILMQYVDIYISTQGPWPVRWLFGTQRAYVNARMLFFHLRIPFAGSEDEKPSRRAEQATGILDFKAHHEKMVVEPLMKNNCTAVPRIRAHECSKQDKTEDASVPGGFIYYILTDRVRGVQLSEKLFWSYTRKERDKVREAYREAWMEWRRA